MKNIVPRSYKLTKYKGNDGRFKTLDPNEAIILSHLPTKWKWIARDYNGDLFLFSNKPRKGHMHWMMTGLCERTDFPYRTMFKTLKWEDLEAINIDNWLGENL